MAEELEERTISKEERDKHPASDFAGKDRSFPIFTPEDVAAAAASLGRAGSDNYSTDQIKANIIRIAKRKGEAFVAKLPKAWKESAVGEEDFDSDVMPLVERAVRNDNTIDLKIIGPGWGTSGYYPAEVLKRDGPGAWQAGTHMYLDHPTESESRERPERSVRDLAAVIISTPEYREEGPAGPGLYAKSSVLPPFKEVIEALAPHIGVSIRAHGKFESGEAEGMEGKVITAITKGESVDFVTKPGAGGKVLAMMESLRQKGASDVVSTEPDNVNDEPASQAAEANRSQEAENMELSEAQERITKLEEELEEAKTITAEATERAQRAEGATAILEAQREAKAALDNVSLPAAAKTRIVTKVSADPPMKDGKVDIDALKEAVEAEQKVEAEYIASLTESGKVTDQGTQSGAPVDDKAVKESLGKGLGRFFGLSDDAAKRAAEGR